MPIVSSFASLSKNGFSGMGASSTQTDWLSVFDTKANTSTTGEVKTINSAPYIVGNGATGAGTFRPYHNTFNVTTGATTTYKIFQDTSLFSGKSDLNDILIDSSNNTHVLFGSISSTDVTIAKYDSVGNFVLGKTITSVGGIGNSVKMAIDASNNIYILSMSGNSGVFITKVDAATYTITWTKFYDFGGSYAFNATSASGKLLIDTSNNIYLVAFSAGSNFVVKINSAGTVVWSKVTMYTPNSSVLKSCLDNSDNFYMMLTKSVPGITNIIIKLDSSGNKLFEYSLSTTLISYLYMTINSVGNLILSNSVANSTIDATEILSIGSLNTTPAVAYTTKFTTSTDQMQVNSLACGTQGTYLGLEFSSNESISYHITMGVLKLPPNCNITGTSSWNFTITTDNSTSYVYNGSITFSNGTTSTLSSTALVTLTTPAITITSISTTSSSTTPGSNATVPFTYNTNIV